ncbi:hypothetical protein M231_06509 [Tremella mesenterica]|uniref:Uncharacterized protein n=1 Tax=Tremella mesenterica TaxID=5217 RepID=A0A4Q1BBT4_TREME|nr:hypothetical protein M231_06509 [Tremella mesenterica]
MNTPSSSQDIDISASNVPSNISGSMSLHDASSSLQGPWEEAVFAEHNNCHVVSGLGPFFEGKLQDELRSELLHRYERSTFDIMCRSIDLNDLQDAEFSMSWRDNSGCYTLNQNPNLPPDPMFRGIIELEFAHQSASGGEVTEELDIPVSFFPPFQTCAQATKLAMQQLWSSLYPQKAGPMGSRAAEVVAGTESELPSHFSEIRSEWGRLLGTEMEEDDRRIWASAGVEMKESVNALDIQVTYGGYYWGNVFLHELPSVNVYVSISRQDLSVLGSQVEEGPATAMTRRFRPSVM